MSVNVNPVDARVIFEHLNISFEENVEWVDCPENGNKVGWYHKLTLNKKTFWIYLTDKNPGKGVHYTTMPLAL